MPRICKPIVGIGPVKGTVINNSPMRICLPKIGVGPIKGSEGIIISWGTSGAISYGTSDEIKY